MDPFLGQIQLFPYIFAPVNWLPCNGQILPVAQYRPLYSLLGTKFGGDGINTFALPDLRGAALGQYNQYYINVINGIYPSRS